MDYINLLLLAVYALLIGFYWFYTQCFNHMINLMLASPTPLTNSRGPYHLQFAPGLCFNI
jgi:hypothetical protein